MELQVSEIQIPERISFNYDELKQELADTLKRYEGLVYTPEQMKLAKADKATLNKLKKALNDERIRREREYMRPFTEFKAQIADLIAAIDKPVALIDRQLREYEEQKKQEKRKQIEEYFESECDFPEWLKFDQIFVSTWLNATCSMKTVEGDLKGMQETICRDLAVLSEMPAFAFEATEVYKQTLNLQTAVNEGKRLADIQKRKEEAERMRAESEARRAAQQAQAADTTTEDSSAVGESAQEVVQSVGENAGQWISFQAFLTVAQAVELRKFFQRNGIEFKAI
jgi:hypothetical protein